MGIEFEGARIARSLSPIGRFERRLEKTLAIKKGNLKQAGGAEAIGNALGEVRQIEKTLSWTPKPSSSGCGSISQATQRMSRGGRP